MSEDELYITDVLQSVSVTTAGSCILLADLCFRASANMIVLTISMTVQTPAGPLAVQQIGACCATVVRYSGVMYSFATGCCHS